MTGTHCSSANHGRSINCEMAAEPDGFTPAKALRSWTLEVLASMRNNIAKHGQPALDGSVAADAPSPPSEKVLQVVHNALLCVAGNYNRCSALLALPSAILRRIFDFVSYDDRWALSQTCQYLRRCCLATPTLWRTIPPRRPPDGVLARLTTNFTRMVALLARRSVPEDLYFQAPFLINDTVDEVLTVELLLPLLPRLRFITLSFRWCGNWGRLSEILDSPAPVMGEARIFCSYEPMLPAAVLPSTLFAGGPEGQLRVMDLQHVRLPPLGQTCDALRNVRTFRWEDRFLLVITPTDLCRILALMPHLETLILNVRDFIWGDADVPIPASCRLRSLELCSITFKNGLHCLRNLCTVTQFTYTSLRLPHAYSLVEDLAAYPLQAFAGPFRSQITVQLESARQPITVRGDVGNLFDQVVWANRLAISPPTAGSLTSLSLHESHWPDSELPPAPPFPTLRWLRVLLSACSERFSYSRGRASGDCVLAQWDLPPWNAPMLETLRIAHAGPPPGRTCARLLSDRRRLIPSLTALNVALYDVTRSETSLMSCYCAKPMAVWLADVYLFARTCILQPGQRLAHLELQGVEAVDPDPTAPLALLQSLADEFTMTSSVERMACDHEGFSPEIDDHDHV